MALNTITPSNREEEYLSAIAGDAGASAPTPSNRREEWLRRIAKHGESIPTVPEAGDSGKVWTAGSEGTAGWETAGGGGSDVLLYQTTTADLSDLPVPADPNYEWRTHQYNSETLVPLSLTDNGPALTYTQLKAIAKSNNIMLVSSFPGDYGDETDYMKAIGFYEVEPPEEPTSGDYALYVIQFADSWWCGVCAQCSIK